MDPADLNGFLLNKMNYVYTNDFFMKKIIIAGLIATTFLGACKNTSKTMITKDAPVFNHLAIYVMDLKATENFYSQIIGLEIVPEPFKDGKHLWLNMGNNTKLHVIEGANKKVAYLQNNHYCFSVPSVTDFVAKLEKIKLPYVNAKREPQAITTRTDGVKQIYFQDPDGYWIEINDDRN